MACFYPFPAYRPRPEAAQRVLCPPYDVVTRAQAEKIAAECPDSFIRIVRAESELPEEDPYSDAVYTRAAENLNALETRGLFFTDDKPLYYIYRQMMNGRSQTGIVGCASIDDYENGVIKKHEITRTEKELDRIRHFDACSADTEPVFFFFRSSPEISRIIERVAGQNEPEYDVTDNQNVRHLLWPVYSEDDCAALQKSFDKLPELYIADGHHRTASAVRVGKKRRAQSPDYDGTEEFNRFMAVAFPADQLKVYDYNRLVRDLNGLTPDRFLNRLADVCSVSEIPVSDAGSTADKIREDNSCGKFHASADTAGKSRAAITADKENLSADTDTAAGQIPLSGESDISDENRVLPQKKHTCSMYLDGKWYLLTFHGLDDASAADPVSALDVSFLQENILAPLLGIHDPKTDKRISFIGGIYGTAELKRRVDSGEMAVAFAMYPVSTDEIIRIADAGLVMPPKSTWFEPKLGSGLFVHRF